jgi:hypothetical protein
MSIHCRPVSAVRLAHDEPLETTDCEAQPTSVVGEREAKRILSVADIRNFDAETAIKLASDC